MIIQQHQISSMKVAAGKQGSVTGFTGAVTYVLDYKTADKPDYRAMFYALTQLAPYCGTGHKTTFGLGETQLGWQGDMDVAVPSGQQVLARSLLYMATLSALRSNPPIRAYYNHLIARGKVKKVAIIAWVVH